MHFLPILLGFMTLTPMISCAPAGSSGAVIDPASFTLDDFTAEFPELALEKRAKTAKPKVAAKPKPAPKPVVAKKPAPKPVAKKPAPAPVAKKPVAAPAAKKPVAVPAAKKPAPVPAAKKPAPVPAAKKPAPAPAAKKPVAPAAKKPVAAPPPAKKPAPAPAAKKPATAPAAKKPATAPAKPAAPAKKPTKTTSAKPAAKTTSAAAVCKRAPNGNCSNCAAFQTCDTCAAQRGCGFSTVTFKCSSVNGTPADTVVAANKRDRCPAVVQQARIFPGVQGKKTGVPAAVAGTPAGLPNANIRAAFAKIEPHIFTRESPSRPDSGQHLKSVWIANHTGAKAVPTCNATTGLCTFNDGSTTGKTVWNDDAGFYTRNDVKNMCSVALALSSGANTRHVVMTPRNQKICIEARPQSANFKAATGAGQGSCFPIGTAAAPGKLDSTC